VAILAEARDRVSRGIGVLQTAVEVPSTRQYCSPAVSVMDGRVICGRTSTSDRATPSAAHGGE